MKIYIPTAIITLCIILGIIFALSVDKQKTRNEALIWYMEGWLNGK